MPYYVTRDRRSFLVGRFYSTNVGTLPDKSLVYKRRAGDVSRPLDFLSPRGPTDSIRANNKTAVYRNNEWKIPHQKNITFRRAAADTVCWPLTMQNGLGYLCVSSVRKPAAARRLGLLCVAANVLRVPARHVNYTDTLLLLCW